MATILDGLNLAGSVLVVYGIGLGMITAFQQHAQERRKVEATEHGDIAVIRAIADSQRMFPRFFAAIEPVRMRRLWVGLGAALGGNLLILGVKAAAFIG